MSKNNYSDREILKLRHCLNAQHGQNKFKVQPGDDVEIRQKHSLGQIFLRDKKYIRKILTNLDIDGKTVLEIGPGKGEISDYLHQRAKYLYCVEIDPRFCNFLKNKFRKKSNVKIIQGNILEFPFSKLGNELVVFGNVPYQISSELVKYLIRNRKHITKVYITFQKEFAQKLIAESVTNAGSFLSYYAQYYARLKKIFDILPEAFFPAPKIKSSFMSLEFYRDLPQQAKDERILFETIRKAFSARRKKIVNSLPTSGDKYEFFYSIGINPDLRPANISLHEYIAIADKLFSQTN